MLWTSKFEGQTFHSAVHLSVSSESEFESEFCTKGLMSNSICAGVVQLHWNENCKAWRISICNFSLLFVLEKPIIFGEISAFTAVTLWRTSPLVLKVVEKSEVREQDRLWENIRRNMNVPSVAPYSRRPPNIDARFNFTRSDHSGRHRKKISNYSLPI